MHSSYNSDQRRGDSYLERLWTASWKCLTFFERRILERIIWRRSQGSPLVQIPLTFIWSKSARPSKALRNRPTNGASLYIPLSGKCWSPEQPSTSAELDCKCDRPSNDLAVAFKPYCPQIQSELQILLLCSICLDLIILLSTSDIRIHVP